MDARGSGLGARKVERPAVGAQASVVKTAHGRRNLRARANIDTEGGSGFLVCLPLGHFSPALFHFFLPRRSNLNNQAQISRLNQQIEMSNAADE
jgi:hypothetical protein